MLTEGLPGKHLHYERRFLNRPGYQYTAAIYANLEEDYGELKIQDCNRLVSFDIELFNSESSPKPFENTIFKLELLEGVVHRFRLALLKQAKSKGYKPSPKEDKHV